jgi:mannitol/fructose-specific phosphotransferase system IIA component (Ntr-type)
MRAKKDEVFTILDSKRQTDGYLTKQFDAAWLTTKENFPVILKEEIYPHRKFTVMRSYILAKK